jgi:alpha-tubulin suppressor-like RCC1 family protein
MATNVTAIAAGSDHSLFLKSDGSLWAMGYNGYGELGDGTYGTAPNYATNRPELIMATNVTAIAAGGSHSLFLKSDGSLWAMGNNQYGQLGDGTSNSSTNRPEQIVATNVTAIAAGGLHSLFLKSDGSLWAMGDNQSGELGLHPNTGQAGRFHRF